MLKYIYIAISSFLLFFDLLFSGLGAFADDRYRPCPEMDHAADAVAKINGASFAVPSYRLPQLPKLTERGEEYHYQFDARHSATGEGPGEKVGIIVVDALRRKGEQICKVLELKYWDTV